MTTDRDEPTEPVDLTPLEGLRLNEARSEALLARVRAAAAPGLERRARLLRGQGRRVSAAREVEQVLARFAWAAMAAAAAAVFLVTRPDSSDPGGSAMASVAQAVTQTDSSTSWIARQSVPTAAELAMALGLENVP